MFTFAAAEAVTLGDRVQGWGLADLDNPISHVVLPPPPPPRNRRLDHGDDKVKGEEIRIFDALAEGLDGDEMTVFVCLAVETGMRESELLGLKVGDIKKTKQTLFSLGDSKNNEPRLVQRP
jgi:integrase